MKTFTTTSKCFKFLLNSSLFIAAILVIGSLSAHAEQSLALQNGQKVKVSCASGATPILKGNTLQCGQSCTLTYFSEVTWSDCDQGGCTGRQDLSLVTLTQDGSKTVLYKELNSGLESKYLVMSLENQFADKCDIITIKENSEPGWHH